MRIQGKSVAYGENGESSQRKFARVDGNGTLSVFLNIRFSSPLSIYVRRHLKRIPAVVWIWRFLKGCARSAPYYAMRLLGHMLHPVTGARGPLRGYHVRTLDFPRRGQGSSVSFAPPGASDAASMDPFQPELFVVVVPDARVLSDGVVISSDHRLLADVSWAGWTDVSDPLIHPAMFKLRLPPIKRVAGRVAVLNSVDANIYYHWLFDVLPRLGLIRKGGLSVDYYFANTMLPFQRDTLRLLGLPGDRLLSSTEETHLLADELVIPSLPGPVYSLSPQRYACEYLRSAFLPKEGARRPHRAIYISRADAGSRRVINEAEIQEELASYDFQLVTLGKLPFAEQVELFADARIVVGPHGAGLANAVFCQPGTVLIEFMPENRVIDCFERTARFVGMTYHAIVGIEDDASSPSHDIRVDPVELKGLLRRYPG